MTVSSFVKRLDFEDMSKHAKKREVFEFTATHDENGNKFSVRIDGRFVDKELAESVWHGNDYLIGFSEEHKGKCGYGGFGFATEKMDMWGEWEYFKSWFDKSMKSRPGYETEEYGQVALF